MALTDCLAFFKKKSSPEDKHIDFRERGKKGKRGKEISM